VIPISDDPRRFDPGGTLLHEARGALVVESSRRHHERLLVKFEGIDSRAEAESLRGALYVAPDDLRTLEAHEYWVHELVGCSVHTRAGAEIGRVARVVPGTTQDLLSVTCDGGERLVPVVKEIVVEVDVLGRRVVVDPPAGLLD
jgi:16S rRNA processing protein RimM